MASPKSKSSASDLAVRDLAARGLAARDPAALVWERAVRLLAAHDRSEQEVRARLAALGVAPRLIDRTIRRLHELRYLDDRRFAAGVTELASRRGHGSEYARAQLVMKGVADALIDEAVGAAFRDETQLARRVLEQRYPTPPQRPAERAKAARFLYQRGFPEAVVLAILGEGC